jgi:hypothetical protein
VGAYASSRHTAAPREVTEAVVPAGSDRSENRDSHSLPRSGPSLDLYGNDVADAVAHYKLDPAGSLYEEHSPQTEVPRLPSPKS